MRTRWALLMLVGCAFLSAGGSIARAADRPNILFILVDDLGKEWLSCYGSQGHRTPNLDRLAEGGLRFDNVYATPLCTPTRCLLMTGRYPHRTAWVKHHDVPRWGGQYFDWEREVAFPRLLKEAGYATGIAGKWQINDFRAQPDALKHHGFDEYCAWTGYETGNPPSDERYFDPYVVRHDGSRGTLEGRFGPDVFCDFLIDFMTRHKDRPFFAYYSMVLTHTPFTKTPHNLDTDKEGIPLFGGMVDYTDHLVGRLITALEDLKIRDRTIVIFTTDNGTVSGVKCPMYGRPIDGGKAALTEPGICVPFIANAPGRVPAGWVTDALVDFSDLLPTFVELAGAKVPNNLVVDGRSFADLLMGRADDSPRTWIYSRLGEGRVIRDKRFKLYNDGRLYDLRSDPWEQHDLTGRESPAAAQARDRLNAVVESFPSDAAMPLPFGHPPAGQATHAPPPR